jgi:hypothetical protein
VSGPTRPGNCSTGSPRLPAPTGRWVRSPPRTSAAKAPACLLAALRSPQVQALDGEKAPLRCLLSAPAAGSGLTTRYTVFQYRPRAKVGRAPTAAGIGLPRCGSSHTFLLTLGASFHSSTCVFSLSQQRVLSSRTTETLRHSERKRRIPEILRLASLAQDDRGS